MLSNIRFDSWLIQIKIPFSGRQKVHFSSSIIIILTLLWDFDFFTAHFFSLPEKKKRKCFTTRKKSELSAPRWVEKNIFLTYHACDDQKLRAAAMRWNLDNFCFFFFSVRCDFIRIFLFDSIYIFHSHRAPSAPILHKSIDFFSSVKKTHQLQLVNCPHLHTNFSWNTARVCALAWHSSTISNCIESVSFVRARRGTAERSFGLGEGLGLVSHSPFTLERCCITFRWGINSKISHDTTFGRLYRLHRPYWLDSSRFSPHHTTRELVFERHSMIEKMKKKNNVQI